jgi:hypothetical protein
VLTTLHSEISTYSRLHRVPVKPRPNLKSNFSSFSYSPLTLYNLD